MKKDIHPKYEEATVKCVCGNTFTTRSTVKEISVEICAACHPFFTGQQKLVDSAGRVERFMKKYGKDYADAEEEPKKAPAEAAPAEEKPAEKPKAEKPTAEAKPAKEPKAEKPPAEDKPAKEPKATKPAPAEKPKAEEPKSEEPAAEAKPADDAPAEEEKPAE